MEKRICSILKKEFLINDLLLFSNLLPSIKERIKQNYPKIKDEDYISKAFIFSIKKILLEELIQNEEGVLNIFKKQVIESIQNNQLITEQEINNYTFGERLSDKIAEFGGSWSFIISFIIFMFLWISINVFIFINKGFDPYPFILLNLILSCLAALQAPIIMMSQNRKEQIDRKRAENDYKINLKAELEIKNLHEKIDFLIFHQNLKIQEIQKLQTEYLDEIILFHKDEKK